MSVGVVTLGMDIVVLPLPDIGYLADPAYGPSSRRTLWHWFWPDPELPAAADADPEPRCGIGAAAAVHTASLVGFGAVIATLPGFDVSRQSVDGLAGGNVLISTALAGITGVCVGAHVDCTGCAEAINYGAGGHAGR